MEIYLPIIIAVVAAMPGIYAAIVQHKRDRIEAENITAQSAKTIQTAAMELIVSYQKRIEELEKTVKELTERIDTLECELTEANNEIKRLEGLNKGYNRRLAGLEK